MINDIKPAFIGHGWQTYVYWESHNKKTLKRINKLIKSIYRDGCLQGIGKPEMLRYQSKLPTYSRRIDDKNRLVYIKYNGMPYIVSCKGHYE